MKNGMESAFEICGSADRSMRKVSGELRLRLSEKIFGKTVKNSGIKPTPRQIKRMGIQRICVKQMGEAVRDE